MVCICVRSLWNLCVSKDVTLFYNAVLEVIRCNLAFRDSGFVHPGITKARMLEDFCTIKINSNRRCGKTSFITTHATENDLVFFYYRASANIRAEFYFPNVPMLPYGSSDVNQTMMKIKSARKTPNYIYMDDFAMFNRDSNAYHWYCTFLDMIASFPWTLNNAPTIVQFGV